MAKYNFDELVNRKGTHAIKLDSLKQNFGDNDLIPLWVADMDFYAANEIRQAIEKTAQQGVYGYSSVPESYYNSIVNWIDNYHNWKIRRDWVDYIPGVVKGISFILDCFVGEGEKVIIQPPVYPPFRSIPSLQKIKVLDNPLKLEAGKFKMDIESLKELIDPSCRVLILCNPHNPGGKIWSKEELRDIADICYEHGVLVISDEIHCDLLLKGNKHIAFASVSEKAAQNSITLMAPSKTFNIAGIVSSFSIIPNDLLRAKFQEYLHARELNSPHMFVAPATEAAYLYGQDWLKECLSYIEENIEYTKNFMKEHTPKIVPMSPDASFLLWLDCRKMEMSQEDLVNFFIKDAKLALNDGISFGKEGEGFMRINLACSRKLLRVALDRLKKAYKTKQF